MRKKRKQCGLIQPKIMKLNIQTLNLIKNRFNLQELTYNYDKHENKHNLFKFLYQHFQNGHYCEYNYGEQET